MEIVFKLPDRTTPGFLRRARQAIQFTTMIQDKPTVQAIDAMVEFLAQFVVEPSDREQAIEALYDASQEQFQELLSALTGESEGNPT